MLDYFPILRPKYFVGRPGVSDYWDRRHFLWVKLKDFWTYLLSLPDTPSHSALGGLDFIYDVIESCVVLSSRVLRCEMVVSECEISMMVVLNR